VSQESHPVITKEGRLAWVWGVPFTRLTMGETLEAIDGLIRVGRPAYFITANVHYTMLTFDFEELREVNERAAFILADGAPLVWFSRLTRAPLPERVAGSDLIFAMSALAAEKGYRLFLLGGAEGVAVRAAQRLQDRYPGLKIVGTECPPFRQPTPEEEEALFDRIRAAQPDILLVAFGQPKGERWIFENLNRNRLGVPVSVQVGASLDFAAGRVSRAPLWMQKNGLEWAFRLSLEPRRLFGRYASNGIFAIRMVAKRTNRRIRRIVKLMLGLQEAS
jgi:N-acetylglucosaminyldiphosphoundecaprenol N-acetyl-beta-D-mannosaminyltransferase